MLRKSELVAICSWMLFLFIGLVLSSCTTTTGNRIPLSQANLTKIKRIGILVKTEGDFSVRVSRDSSNGMGGSTGGLLGLVGYAIGSSIEEEVRSYVDRKLHEELKPKLGDFDPKKLMEERLHHYMQLTKVFVTKNIDQNVLEGKKLDGVLEVTLKDWGFRSSTCPDSTKEIQVGLEVQGSMLLLEDQSTVWERNQLYLDGECYSLEHFRNREGLLEDVLTRAIDNLSSKIVYEICYPTNPADLHEAPKESPLMTIKPMNITLLVEDQRDPNERDRVEDKEYYGGADSKKELNKDVTILLYEALENELKKNGHRVVGAKETPDVFIHTRLTRYWSNCRSHFWDVEMIGTISSDITVRDPRNESVLFSKPLNTTFRESRQIVSQGAVNRVLNNALAEFIRNFSHDPGLLKALQLAQ